MEITEFKSIVKEASSALTRLVFVKVPDSLRDLIVNNEKQFVTGTLATIDGAVRWTSPELPMGVYVFNGYSHRLTEEKINELFASRAEFYQMCGYHDIYYNYSAYTGKWAVLSVVR